MPNSYLADGQQPYDDRHTPRCPAVRTQLAPDETRCGLPAGHTGSHQIEHPVNGVVTWPQNPWPAAADKLRPIDSTDSVTVSWNASQLFMHDNANPSRSKLAAVAVDSDTAQHLAHLAAAGRESAKASAELARKLGTTQIELNEAVQHREILSAKLVATSAALARLRNSVRNAIGPMPGRESLSLEERLVLKIGGLGNELDKARAQRNADAPSNIVQAALHMVRRLNTIVGQPDAKVFTRTAAEQVVDDVLELVTKLRESRRETEQDRNTLAGEVRRLGESRDEWRGKFESLQVNSRCPRLQPVDQAGDVTMVENRHCVRVNQHDGAHIRPDGVSW
jgi:hypothetical protein